MITPVPTPEDRLATVERHALHVCALAEALDGVAAFAHLTDRAELGFIVGFLADRLHQDADAILAAAATYRREASR